jgi:hypothetical protein
MSHLRQDNVLLVLYRTVAARQVGSAPRLSPNQPTDLQLDGYDLCSLLPDSFWERGDAPRSALFGTQPIAMRSSPDGRVGSEALRFAEVFRWVADSVDPFRLERFQRRLLTPSMDRDRRRAGKGSGAMDEPHNSPAKEFQDLHTRYILPTFAGTSAARYGVFTPWHRIVSETPLSGRVSDG